MTYAQAVNALQEYGQVAASSQALNASPHRLILMLLSGAIDRINAAKGDMQHHNIPAKGENISSAINIIGGLRSSLDEANGGDIARNLSSLYEYVERALVDANIKNDAEQLNIAMKILGDIKEAWEGIPMNQRSVTSPDRQVTV